MRSSAREDVYKRQSYFLQRFRNGLDRSRHYLHQHGGRSALAVRPVSYTHLDVYKRQLQGRTGRIGFGVLDTDTRIINLHNLDFYAP